MYDLEQVMRDRVEVLTYAAYSRVSRFVAIIK